MNKGRQVAYELLGVLILLSVFTMIFRLWPLVIIMILGIFVATIVLLFYSLKSNKREEKEQCEINAQEIKEPTVKDLKELAYSLIVSQVTKLVKDDYPDATWVWEKANSKNLIEEGKDVFIILNKAGGYSKAKVVIVNLQVNKIEYITSKSVTEIVDDILKPEIEQVENFGLVAFEWVEANIMSLNDRINEAIGQGNTELVINSSELPVKEAHVDVCKELIKEGIKNVECVPEGIKIYIPKLEEEYKEETSNELTE